MGRIDYIDDPRAPAVNSVVPSVVAIVTDDDGRVLMIHKTDNNKWALPGGGPVTVTMPVMRSIRQGWKVSTKPSASALGSGETPVSTMGGKAWRGTIGPRSATVPVPVRAISATVTPLREPRGAITA